MHELVGSQLLLGAANHTVLLGNRKIIGIIYLCTCISKLISMWILSGNNAGSSLNLGSGFHPGVNKESRTITLQKGKDLISYLSCRPCCGSLNIYL